MTRDEARKLVDECWSSADIAAIIQQSVAAEREACAKLAEQFEYDIRCRFGGKPVAAAIRARSQEGAKP